MGVLIPSPPLPLPPLTPPLDNKFNSTALHWQCTEKKNSRSVATSSSCCAGPQAKPKSTKRGNLLLLMLGQLGRRTDRCDLSEIYILHRISINNKSRGSAAVPTRAQPQQRLEEEQLGLWAAAAAVHSDRATRRPIDTRRRRQRQHTLCAARPAAERRVASHPSNGMACPTDGQHPLGLSRLCRSQCSDPQPQIEE